MKTFIIVVETAILAFVCGAAYERTLARAKIAENDNPDNNEATVE